MITMGAQLFGCGLFLEGQEKDCDCLDEKELNERVLITLNELYDKLPENKQKTTKELNKVQQKYKGKEVKLINNILKKYPKELIQMVDWDGNPVGQKAGKDEL